MTPSLEKSRSTGLGGRGGPSTVSWDGVIQEPVVERMPTYLLGRNALSRCEIQCSSDNVRGIATVRDTRLCIEISARSPSKETKPRARFPHRNQDSATDHPHKQEPKRVDSYNPLCEHERLLSEQQRKFRSAAAWWRVRITSKRRQSDHSGRRTKETDAGCASVCGSIRTSWKSRKLWIH